MHTPIALVLAVAAAISLVINLYYAEKDPAKAKKASIAAVVLLAVLALVLVHKKFGLPMMGSSYGYGDF